jgi:hypothetical protein
VVNGDPLAEIKVLTETVRIALVIKDGCDRRRPRTTPSSEAGQDDAGDQINHRGPTQLPLRP